MASVLGSDGEELPDDRDGPGRVEDRQPDDPALLDRVVFWEIVAVEWAGELALVGDEEPPPEGGWPAEPAPAEVAEDVVPEPVEEDAPGPAEVPRPQRRRRWYDPATWWE